jgi:hypothetical protein
MRNDKNAGQSCAGPNVGLCSVVLEFNDPRVAPLTNALYGARRVNQPPESLCSARE